MLRSKTITFVVAVIWRWISLAAFIGAFILIWARLPELTTTTLHMTKGGNTINTYWMMDSFGVSARRETASKVRIQSEAEAASTAVVTSFYQKILHLFGLGYGLIEGGFATVDPWLRDDILCVKVTAVLPVYTKNRDNNEDTIYTTVSGAGVGTSILAYNDKKDLPEKLVCDLVLADESATDASVLANRHKRCVKAARNVGIMLDTMECPVAQCGLGIFEHKVRFRSDVSKDICEMSRIQDVHITPNDLSSGMISTQHTQTLVVLCLLIVWMWGWYSCTRFAPESEALRGDNNFYDYLTLNCLSAGTKMFCVALFIIATLVVGFGHIVAYSTEVVSKIDNHPLDSEQFKWNEDVLKNTEAGFVWQQPNELVVRKVPHGSIVYALISTLILGLYVVREINDYKDETKDYGDSYPQRGEASHFDATRSRLDTEMTTYAANPQNFQKQKDMEWNVKSFADGVTSSQQYKRIPVQGAYTPEEVTIEQQVLSMRNYMFEDENDILLKFDGGVIFKLFLLPAVLLAAFSHMNAFVLDVSWQGVLLGSLGYGVIDLFARRFQQICGVVRTLEGRDSQVGPLRENGLFKLLTAMNCQCILEIVVNVFKGLCLWYVFTALGTFNHQQVYGWRTGAHVDNFDQYNLAMRYAPIGVIIVVSVLDTLFSAVNIMLDRTKPSGDFGGMTVRDWQNVYQLVIILVFVVAIALQIGHLNNLRDLKYDSTGTNQNPNWRFEWHVKKWRSSYTAFG